MMSMSVKGVVVGVLVVGAVGVGVFLFYNKTSLKPQVTNPNLEVPVVSPTPIAREEATGSGEIKEVTVVASNYKFTPATIKVKKGDTVRLALQSSEGIHNLAIDEFEVATNDVNVGEEEEVEFVASKSGTFEYYCDRHLAEGMKGSLIVE